MSSKIVEALEIGLAYAQRAVARYEVHPSSSDVPIIESALAEARAAPPAPAAEPVAWHVIHEEGGSHIMLADSVDDRFRAALSSAGRRVRPLIYGDTAPPPVESSQQQCPCGDRPASKCPGEWEPGCDLGANEKFARRVDEASQQQDDSEYRINVAPELKARLEARTAQIAEWPDYMQRAAQQQADPASGELSQRLNELLNDYWQAAYSEGKEGRNHDTSDNRAQRTLAAIHDEFPRLTAERDASERALCAMRNDCLALERRGDKLIAELSAAKAEAEALREVVRCLRAILPDERWADDAKRMADAAIAAQQGEKP